MKTKKSKFKKNYKPVIGVVALAILLWFMVKMSRVYEYQVKIPIEYVNLDADKIFKYNQDLKAEVEFTGRGLDLLRLPMNNITCQIDLHQAPLRQKINLVQHSEYVKFPNELDVNVKSIISPRILDIQLDHRVSKKIPVTPDYQLTTPPGYVVVRLRLVPDSIIVTGPSEMFNFMHNLSTEKQTFENRNHNFQEKFSIIPDMKYYAEYAPKTVSAKFDIQRLAEKEILSIPVHVINKPPNLEIIPLPSETIVYIKGGEREIADLGPDDFNVYIDFKKSWHQGARKVKAFLQTKSNVMYMETRPSEFELIIQRKKMAKK